MVSSEHEDNEGVFRVLASSAEYLSLADFRKRFHMWHDRGARLESWSISGSRFRFLTSSYQISLLSASTAAVLPGANPDRFR